MAVELVLVDLDETLAPTGFLRDARHSREPLALSGVPGFSQLVPHCGIEDALFALANRYTVGLVTSSPRWYVDQLLGILLSDYPFQVIVTYDDVARIKPDPEPLLQALERATIPAGRAVYVGDDLVDHLASCSAGIPFLGAGWAEQPTYPSHARQVARPGDLLTCIEGLTP